MSFKDLLFRLGNETKVREEAEKLTQKKAAEKDTMAFFINTFGEEPEIVNNRKVTIDGLTLVNVWDDFGYGAWAYEFICPDCEKPALTERFFDKHQAGVVLLDGLKPSKNHRLYGCLNLSYPEKDDAQKLYNLIVEIVQNNCLYPDDF